MKCPIYEMFFCEMTQRPFFGITSDICDFFHLKSFSHGNFNFKEKLFLKLTIDMIDNIIDKDRLRIRRHFSS